MSCLSSCQSSVTWNNGICHGTVSPVQREASEPGAGRPRGAETTPSAAKGGAGADGHETHVQTRDVLPAARAGSAPRVGACGGKRIAVDREMDISCMGLVNMMPLISLFYEFLFPHF